MTIKLIAAGIIAPVFFWIGFFYYKDRKKPEPLHEILLAYLMGLVAAFLCYKAYALLPYIGLPEDASIIMENDRIQFFWYCLGPVGLMEEFFKFLPFLVVIFCFKAFDEKIDGIIYASVIGVGFASFENFYYLPLLDGFPLLGRAFASPLTHSIFASIWGHMAGTAYLKKEFLLIESIVGIIISAILHGLFDFLATSPTFRVLSSLIILSIWIWQIRVIDKMSKQEITG